MLYVYIMASERNGTLYVGVTNDLVGRVWQHKNGVVPGFTSRYRVHLLVHFEYTEDPYEAIRREKQLKRWRRSWKLKLIEDNNPEWNDLFPVFSGAGVPVEGNKEKR
jgi:putative endonuclease